MGAVHARGTLSGEGSASSSTLHRKGIPLQALGVRASEPDPLENHPDVLLYASGPMFIIQSCELSKADALTVHFHFSRALCHCPVNLLLSRDRLSLQEKGLFGCGQRALWLSYLSLFVHGP